LSNPERVKQEGFPMLNNPVLNNLALLAARVLIAGMFIKAGYDKIGTFAGVQKYMDAFGIPGVLLPLVIVLEIGAGLALLVGWKARLAALALAGFTLVAAFIFHFKLSDQAQYLFFVKNLAITGGLLALFASGPGAYSVERR
jgi:putative oxidoreductase